MKESNKLWSPSSEFIENSHLHKYRLWVEKKYSLNIKDTDNFKTYENLWEWSVDNHQDFWKSIFEYFEILHDGSYTEVHENKPMPGIEWFQGVRLNYSEHIFRKENEENPAIIFGNESEDHLEISWKELREKVAAFASYLKAKGVKEGDRVVAFIPNIPEATIGFLAANSLGAIWSSCSPDFGADSVVDRFKQIEAKILIAVGVYKYGGKVYDKRDVVEEIISSLPTLEEVVFVDHLTEGRSVDSNINVEDWTIILEQYKGSELTFNRVDFNHPIWVLYSSGTTGNPKAITHSHGGVLLEHLKYVAFHNDVHQGERFFWFSTTGWMMWNFVQASMLMGATIVLYDGSPGFPSINHLWRFAEKAKIAHFGTSAPFLIACMKKGICPKDDFDLSALRSIGSTGSPLPPESFDWTYKNIKEDVWLCSMAGGTDVCTAFVGGNPTLPLYLGEIQSRALGCSLYSYNEEGDIIYDEVGEMVITKPMPSMPIFFWKDENHKRYSSSYFEHFEGIWRHGDWISIDKKKGSLMIYGRSDATLNRQGIRIGTSEIYRAVDKVSEVKDSLIVNLELSGGRHFMPLFVAMSEGAKFDDALVSKIKKTLRDEYTPRHVPDAVVLVKDIPCTISGKKMEAPIKKILMKMSLEKSVNIDSMRNPETLQFFIDYAETIH